MSVALQPCSNPLRVVVLQGGTSAEREISLKSGAAVSAALTGRGHLVRRTDPADAPLTSVDWPRFDAAFIALHGRFGEDGGVQALLDGWGVPYTGSDASASRLAFSKSASKERFAACHVPTPAYRLVHISDSLRHLRQAAKGLGYPLVMKPDASGSSLGVSFVNEPGQLQAAAERCFEQGSFGLLEQAVAGTEWTLAVVDGERLPLIRIEPRQTFYDFAAKYEDGETGYCLDPDVSPELMRTIEEVGAAACRAVGTRGIARADLRVDAALKPWVLEVNTIPGLTDHSLVPKAADRHGWSLGELCERAVRSCLRDRLSGPPNSQDAQTRQDSPSLREAS